MDFTFVPQYTGGAPKRKRLSKACDACRARKKRCYHQAQEDEPDETSATHDSTPTSSRDGKHGDSTEGNGIGVRPYRGTSASASKGRRQEARFMSDLHPETSFLERNPTDGENKLAKSTDSIGVWVDRQDWQTLIRQRDAAVEAGFISDRLERETDRLKAIRPHSAQLAGLIDVYFKKIHPLLPLIDEAEFRKAHADGILPEPFVHALCLAAAKDKEAEEFLRLPDSTQSLSPRKLCHSLHASVKAAVAAPVRYDKITLIRMLALLSMHSEGSEGAEEGSLWLTQAMHHSSTLGLHISATYPTKDGTQTKHLFWCLWILDRWSSSTNGRPIIMADQDLAIEPFQPGESGFPAFEVLLKITGMLNDVIAFYRPGKPPTSTGWEYDFPGFEAIVEEMDGWPLPASTLSTLHIAYLAVAILSHRSKSVKDAKNTTPSHVRQSLAAMQIIRLMSPERLRALHALPLTPYAISLALSVSYQHLRQDQLKHQQDDARADFEACFVILQELKKTWSSTDAMVTLSERVLDELKRAKNTSAFRVQKASKAHTAIEGFSSACRHEGEAVDFSQRAARSGSVVDGSLVTPDLQASLSQTDLSATEPTPVQYDLFEGIDDIFGTYLDPNYPVNLDWLDDIGMNGDFLNGSIA